MKIKLQCADKEARKAILKVCSSKDDKTEFEELLCDIVPFADTCEREE